MKQRLEGRSEPKVLLACGSSERALGARVFDWNRQIADETQGRTVQV